MKNILAKAWCQRRDLNLKSFSAHGSEPCPPALPNNSILIKSYLGAAKRTRTSMGLLPLAPEASASTSSAITA